MFAALAVIGLLAAITLPASAQVPTFGYTGTSAFTVTNSTANAVGTVIDVSKQASVGIMLSVTANTNATINTGFYFTRSIDGTTFESAGQLVTVITAAVTQKNVLTNLQSYGAQYLKLSYVTNDAPAGCTITNCLLTYGTKISAP